MSSFLQNSGKNLTATKGSAQKISFYRPQSHSANSVPIVVHCHLHWDWVWQRPQQFLSRLAKTHPVLFVETHPPSPDLKNPTVNIRELDGLDVTVCQIQFPLAQWHDGDYVDRTRRKLLQETLAGPLHGRFDDPVQWFYDPMAATAFAGHIKSRAIVYDCMDELSQFRGANPEILSREKELLAAADVVFTGGRKLWEAKKKANANCFFYGCGVDVDHFGRATEADLPLPADVAHLSKPVLGYFGVVDERLDYDLLEKIAAKNPDWNLVIVGPTAKVDPAHLPRRKNIHWLGGRDYSELPAYAKAFDVCLMPFALNAATEYINPTKALEYMATGTPVVSTAVADVISNFSEAVHIGKSAEEFEKHCTACLAKPDRKKINRGLRMATDNTWDSIVEHLEQHLLDAMSKKSRPLNSRVRAVKFQPRREEASLSLAGLAAS